MLYSLIGGTLYTEVCKIYPTPSDMHLQKCLTFGVHIMDCLRAGGVDIKKYPIPNLTIDFV